MPGNCAADLKRIHAAAAQLSLQRRGPVTACRCLFRPWRPAGRRLPGCRRWHDSCSRGMGGVPMLLQLPEAAGTAQEAASGWHRQRRGARSGYRCTWSTWSVPTNLSRDHHGSMRHPCPDAASPQQQQRGCVGVSRYRGGGHAGRQLPSRGGSDQPSSARRWRCSDARGDSGVCSSAAVCDAAAAALWCGTAARCAAMRTGMSTAPNAGACRLMHRRQRQERRRQL